MAAFPFFGGGAMLNRRGFLSLFARGLAAAPVAVASLSRVVLQQPHHPWGRLNG